MLPQNSSEGLALSLNSFQLLIPAGISYYTFKAMSYVFDIYLCKMRNPKNVLDVFLYISFFPQLTAGPIVQASDFLQNLHSSLTRDFQKCCPPIQVDRSSLLIMSGLFKKVIIANFLTTIFTDRIFTNPSIFNTWELLLAVLSYSIVIYADFSGYSDMAIGIALLLGFETPANFNRPYMSKSISEFWRRWHITFSSWLRDYLYFGMGGSRYGLNNTLAALFITMVIAGLWHGAGWMFLLWGALQGFLLMIERIFYEQKRVKTLGFPAKRTQNTETKGSVVSCICNFIKILLVFFIINISWLIFSSHSISELLLFIKSLKNTDIPFKLVSPFIILLIGIGFVMQIPSEKIREKLFKLYTLLPLIVKAVFFAAFLIFIYSISMSGIAPYIYFSF